MKRRLSMILLPVAVVSLTAGCTTFSDNDAAARVDDVELSYDVLDEINAFIGGFGEAGVVFNELDGDGIRNSARVWIEYQALSTELADEGVEIDQDLRDTVTADLSQSAGFADLSAEADEILVGYLAIISQINGLENGAELFVSAFEDLDIHVDPRIGTFDPDAGGVIALG